jgi:hypothetical protein
MCAQLHFNVCKGTGVKLDNEHWYERVPKSGQTSRKNKVTVLRINMYKPTEPSQPDIIIRDNEKEKGLNRH